MSAQKKGAAHKKSHRFEFFIINIFSFVCIGLLALFVLNFALFNPFTLAFKDFSLTDVYYAKVKKQDSIYRGPLVLVNVEDRSRGEIAFLLQRIQEGKPKVVGVDVIFRDRKDSTDDLLKEVFASSSNLVLPYAAKFDDGDSAVYSNSYFGVKSNAFVNLIGEQREFSTIRSYYPVYKNSPAFTTAIIQKFDPELARPLEQKKEEKTDIRFWGNLQNFEFYTFDSLLNPAFDVSKFANKIVLVGYLGLHTTTHNTLDEDRFYTPLNSQLAGRSHPDMYGLVVHANILRMALDRDYIVKVPAWLNWVLAFLLSWALIPIFVKWYVYKPMWSHFFTKVTQLAITILAMYITVVLYAAANLKLEPASILVAVLLLGDFVLFYDGLVKFLKLKLGWRINSIYFEGHGH